MKTARLNTVHDGGPMVERLQEEIKDYKSILKCSVCHDRPKEVLYYFPLHYVNFIGAVPCEFFHIFSTRAVSRFQ